MTTVYFAKHILLDTGEILLNGAVSVCGGAIAEVGPRGTVRRSSDERTVNLGDILLLPGLINMHTHLEEAPIRSYTKEPGESYTAWNSSKYSRMRQLTPEQVRSGIKLSAREMAAQGITTVADTTRTGISAEALSGEAVRAVIIREIADEEFLDEGIEQVRAWMSDERGGPAFGYGAAPHAVYSLSPRGHRKIIEQGYGSNCLWACHAAESAEEMQAFCDQAGDFFFSQTRKYPWPAGDSRLGPIQYAITENLIPSRAILYHCNYVTGYDLGLLAAKRAFITICRGYSKVMGHKDFPVELARNRGVRICLGTEGVVAAGGTNLFDDLFELKREYPHISALELLGWVTKNPAAALRASDKLGSITPAKCADIVGVRFPYETVEDLLERLVMSDPKVAFVMIGGEEVIVDC